MLKKQLSLLLILLIASQSVWAMMDTPHQHSNEHFITKHQHDHSTAEPDSTAHSDHYHCHNVQLHFLSGSIAVPLNSNKTLLNAVYRDAASSIRLTLPFTPCPHPARA